MLRSIEYIHCRDCILEEACSNLCSTLELDLRQSIRGAFREARIVAVTLTYCSITLRNAGIRVKVF